MRLGCILDPRTPTADESVRRSNNVLVEESGGPDLAWHESATQDADEESQCNQTGDIVHQPSHGRRNGASEKHANICPSWTKAITERARNESNDQGAGQRGDIGVCNIGLRQMEVLFDRPREQWRESVPRQIVSYKYSSSDHDIFLPTPESNKEPPPREEEYSSILIDRIQHRDRSGLPVDGIYNRRTPENRR